MSDVWGSFVSSAVSSGSHSCDIAKAWDDFSSTADRCEVALHALFVLNQRIVCIYGHPTLKDACLMLPCVEGIRLKAAFQRGVARAACGVIRRREAATTQSRRARTAASGSCSEALRELFRLAVPDVAGLRVLVPVLFLQVALNNLRCCFLEEQVYNRRAHAYVTGPIPVPCLYFCRPPKSFRGGSRSADELQLLLSSPARRSRDISRRVSDPPFCAGGLSCSSLRRFKACQRPPFPSLPPPLALGTLRQLPLKSIVSASLRVYMLLHCPSHVRVPAG